MSRGVGRGIVRDIREGFPGGCAASGDEDLVGGEAEVGIGELNGELTERRGEIDGWFGRRCELGRRRRCRLPLRMAEREVSEEVSHCQIVRSQRNGLLNKTLSCS